MNGLFIEGAKWNLGQTCMEEQLPKILIDTMPIIHLIVSIYNNNILWF